ncbi:MAG: aminopeptidase [Sandaracinus sp.]|nr:aminopeptidase [Sandaracinus sp.]
MGAEREKEAGADLISSGERRSQRVRRDSITVSQDAETHLAAYPPDHSLADPARAVLENAIGLSTGQLVVLVVEVGCEAFGRALLAAAVELGLETRTYLVDMSISRSLPFRARLESHLAEADGSVMVGTVGGLDAEFRRRVCTLPGRRRHAHMVGVSEAMMRQSLRSDWSEVHQVGERLRRRLARARRIDVDSGLGCTLRVDLDDAARWHNGSGWLREPGFSNLPGGEVVTCPARAEGAYRADGGVWLHDGTAIRSPHVLRFHRGSLVEVEGPDADSIWRAADADPQGRRLGQVAFGTNLNVLTPIGAMLQDLKMPGLHLVLGYSCPEHTGASWSASSMVAALGRRLDVVVDGEPLLVRGRYARSVSHG